MKMTKEQDKRGRVLQGPEGGRFTSGKAREGPPDKILSGGNKSKRGNE